MQPDFSGQTLGKYELRELLGEGGMGAVYRAYDHNLKREVAVKIINLAKNDTALRGRFIREAETAASLEHNHIVRIYDYGVERDINYIVMQHLTGGALSDRMKQASEEGRPRASLQEVALLLDQLASALDYAHAQGVIHRDIKPQNVMFNNHGQAFIVDFGIAKLLTGATNMTGTGMAMGTPSYMSPEQWTTDNIVPASDQYALAVMTYQLIAGRLPFEADTPMRVMYRHLNDQPTPLNTFRPDIPADLLLVMERALSKDPEQRFPNCTQFAQAFSSAVSAVSVGKTEFFTFKLARIRPSGVPYTPTPGQPSFTPATPASNLSLPAIPLTQQPKSGPSRNLLIGGLGALVVMGILAVLLLGNRGPSESDLRLTEVNSTLIAAGLATERIETRESRISLIATETPELINTTEPTATDTDEPSPTASDTASPTLTTAPTETETIAPSHTPTETATETASLTPSATDTVTETASNTPTDTSEPTLDFALLARATLDTEATLTATLWTPTPTENIAATIALIAANTRSAGATSTATLWTLTPSATMTSTSTFTPTVTITPSHTSTVTATPSLTPTRTISPTQTVTLIPGNDCQDDFIQIGCVVLVTFTRASVRALPSVSSDAIMTLSRGEEVVVIGGPNNAWWQIEINGLTGWISASFVENGSSASKITTNNECSSDIVKIGCIAEITYMNVALRTKASISSNRLRTLELGQEVMPISKSPDELWWQIEVNGISGWVSRSFLQPLNAQISPAPTPDYATSSVCAGGTIKIDCDAYIYGSNARMRTRPSINGSLLRVLSQGEKVIVKDGPREADGYTWWRVQAGDWWGWVAENLLTADSP